MSSEGILFVATGDTHRAEALMATCEISLRGDTVRISIEDAGADAPPEKAA